MDNETHMLFHDIDIEEVTRVKTRKETRKQTRKEIRNENSKVIQEIFRCLAAGMSQDEIVEQLKRKFAFTNNEVKEYYLSTITLIMNNTQANDKD